jgi:hypothetical protein
MKFPEPKNDGEHEALELVFNQVRGEWGFASGFGPSELLRHWQEFVQEVEDGYKLSIYDFTFDLSMRDVLEEIQAAVPLRLRQEIEAVLLPLDERYKCATLPSEKPIDAGADENAKEWWFRIPKLAGPEVEKYLFENGLRVPR